MDGLNLFTQINNAVLDLQAAQYQTYQRPLKTLARLLRHDDLAAANAKLTSGLDLETFLARQDSDRGMGGGTIEWPDDPDETLGLTLLLIFKFAEDPDFMGHFGHSYYGTGSSKIVSGIHGVTGQLIILFVRDYKTYVTTSGQSHAKLILPTSNKIFIVHGHDEGALNGLARFLEKLKLEVIILKEQPNQGRTIIEKYETSAAEVGFAVVLLTPDDVGSAVAAEGQNQRARQNVIFELGYFAGKLGRGRVCLLRKGNVEIPSDLFGIVYTDMDPGEGWKQALVKELKAAKIDFDANRMWE
ncbi:nucleotide-binding protein (plasmid) [Sinorhizobium medicae]|uniref:nucleotide-binding protein n=1 Tax=Sinorhizobium medicae TaxID=110321 RepID=UPI002AF6B192|nr:nucleotide-binding protein [Sinorhizobium medicae]WQO48049.1 nucleotide-binding protein [Sinorhizobium medicae]WQO68406.1 nucleotide-binding protein [Sinorhizobium medicae]WQO75466.1 nucleotide-binding protein [Sinorhizobium medicae]WQO94659.1 nucleotide-binding protein [Sinorhizobium medicae]